MFSRTTTATQSPKVNQCKHIRGRLAPPHQVINGLSQVGWCGTSSSSTSSPDIFCRASGYVLLQETPWGWMAALLWGSDAKIEVEVLCKRKLLFSTKSREFSSTLGDKTEPYKDVYTIECRKRRGLCDLRTLSSSAHLIKLYWGWPGTWHSSGYLGSISEENRHKPLSLWSLMRKTDEKLYLMKTNKK